MALKDLASDLANFKYDQTSPDKVDSQINKGVDFFDNKTGGADGFTPKTDLKSLYHKVQNGAVAPVGGNVAPYANMSPIEGRKSSFGDSSRKWPINQTTPPKGNTNYDNLIFRNAESLNNPQSSLGQITINDIGGFSLTNQPAGLTISNPRHPNANGSDFMTTPLADYNSGYSPPNDLSETFSLAPADLETPDFSSWMAFSPIGDSVTQFASLLPLVDRVSNFSTSETIGNVGAYTAPLEYTISPQTTLNLRKENWRYSTDAPNDLFDSEFSPLGLGASQFTNILDMYQNFSEGDFTNVPTGMGTDNLFPNLSLGMGASFRKVANKGPFAGNNTHPIYIRPMGSNWDDVLTETPGLGGDLGSILEGALDGIGLLTRTSRDLADKVRIGTFLDSPAGSLFRAKQFAFQALNPTIESKIYNPSSTLGIAGNIDFFTGNFLRGMLMRAGSYLLPTHVERHVGGLRYENVINLIPYDSDFEQSSRLAFQAKAFTSNVPIPPRPVREGAIGLLDRAINFGISLVDDATSNLNIGLSNPNKYIWPVSSAPKSVHNGVPSFIGGPDLAIKDTDAAANKPGGTFNKNTAEKTDGQLIKRHSTKAYSVLTENSSYEPLKAGKEIVNQIGSPGLITTDKGSLKSPGVDKINALHYPLDYDESPTGDVKDFIKFRFKDVVNNRFIIFRAILDGISDSITPEYGEERYIGRPDKVYVYQGADRNVSFNFSIYPKTKQEFPILMGKLNHLIGLCYPSYTEQDMMITPFIELTLGDMFVESSGILMGLSVTVEDNGTWEIDDGLQFPHYMKVACEFRHIGNDKLSSTSLKHYNGLKHNFPSSDDGSSLAIRRTNSLPDIDFGANIEPVAVPVL